MGLVESCIMHEGSEVKTRSKLARFYLRASGTICKGVAELLLSYSYYLYEIMLHTAIVHVV